jgi:hypothetical protein
MQYKNFAYGINRGADVRWKTICLLKV